MNLVIRLIDFNGKKGTLIINGTTSGNSTAELKKLWDMERLINEANTYLRCHIDVVE